MMNNTKIEYLYRDASNYKVFNEAIVAGTADEQLIQTILNCLDEGEYFIPSIVGLPSKQFDDIGEDDHPWFELYESSFSETTLEPTVDMSLKELAARFQKAASEDAFQKAANAQAFGLGGQEEPCADGPWQDYADEHILFLRALNGSNPSAFEYVKVVRDVDLERCLFSHGVVFVDDFLSKAGLGQMDEILKGFGYNGLDGFVKDVAGDRVGWLYLPNGQVDRMNSPGYIIDIWLLASLLVESMEDSIPMPEADAVAMVNLYLEPCGQNIKCIP